MLMTRALQAVTAIPQSRLNRSWPPDPAGTALQAFLKCLAFSGEANKELASSLGVIQGHIQSLDREKADLIRIITTSHQPLFTDPQPETAAQAIPISEDTAVSCLILLPSIA